MGGVGLKSFALQTPSKTSEWPQRRDGPILKAEAQLDKALFINRYPLRSQTGSYMESNKQNWDKKNHKLQT
jgi:hypothetical protein